jgi:S-(hydroxymethyl)glutathione dehydrogenase/alcohol dehydrogenase
LERKLTAAVLFDTKQPLKICELEIPKLKEGQVLVKIFYSGVCRSQLMEARGGRGQDPWLPHLLGHEASGEVIEIGPNVTKVKIGDNVILGWIKSDGIEAEGAKYIYNNHVINSGKVTTFSNYSIVSENRLVIIPAKIPLDIAVLFGCALLTGAGMVLNELKPNSQMTVIVIGLGGIGLSALMALKYLNCKKIIAIDISDEKLELAKLFGATHTFNSRDTNLFQQIKDLTIFGADACIESGGKTETIELGFALISKKGKLIFASHPPEGEKISIAPHELIAGKQIFGSWGGGCNPDSDVLKLAEIYLKSSIPLDKLIVKRYTLNQINLALDDLDLGKVFRPLICMNH